MYSIFELDSIRFNQLCRAAASCAHTFGCIDFSLVRALRENNMLRVNPVTSDRFVYQSDVQLILDVYAPALSVSNF